MRRHRAVDFHHGRPEDMGQGDVPWSQMARDSILLRAVSHWRGDSEEWLSGSFDRLPETVRVNPLRTDRDWTEGWLKEIGSKRITWFGEPGSAWELPFERGSAGGEVKQVLNLSLIHI